MNFIENPKVTEIIQEYPGAVQQRLLYLRKLILDTASETEGVSRLEETLKWGEPSYTAKGGSTIRIDWKKATPGQYAMYFICTTSLVDTFRMIYGDQLIFEGNRAIVFPLDMDIPVKALKHCITLALTYHRVKHLPLLGA